MKWNGKTKKDYKSKIKLTKIEKNRESVNVSPGNADKNENHKDFVNKPTGIFGTAKDLKKAEGVLQTSFPETFCENDFAKAFSGNFFRKP